MESATELAPTSGRPRSIRRLIGKVNERELRTTMLRGDSDDQTSSLRDTTHIPWTVG